MMTEKNLKSGIFVFITLLLLFVMILRISQGRFFYSRDYTLYMDVESAVGLGKNTPVQIAGVDVGVVKNITLVSSTKARLKLSIDHGIKISTDAIGRVKTTGILGDAYIEIFQQEPIIATHKEGGVISKVESYGDLNSVTGQLGTIAEDVKAITTSMRKVMAGDDSAFSQSLKNIEKISASLAHLTTRNDKNIEAIIVNMQQLTRNLNTVVAANMGHFDNSLANIDRITTDIENGRGTVGRLLKDDATVEKLNDTLDELRNAIGGFNRWGVDVGAHTEYLGGTGSFKNYVTLELSPRPDKIFLFEAVSDPDPTFRTQVDETIVTSGGTTSTVTTERRTKNLNQFLFSFQLAKKFEDFTLRGGLIESTGGIGIDYDKGPFGVSLSAYDFKTDSTQRPHLKLMGTTQLTRTFYLLGGLDDFVNQTQDLDWYLGAGITFGDDDLKSLLGLMSSMAK